MFLLTKYRYTALSSPDPESSTTDLTPPYDRLRWLREQLREHYVRLVILGAVTFAILIGLGFYFGRPQSQTHGVKTGLDGQKLPVVQFEFGPESSAAATLRLERQSAVKDAFRHAWDGYKKHAWLSDEVKPISGGPKDNYNGWAATLVDGLDTLWIMGLKDEFEEAVAAVETINFQKPKQERVNFFESTIRYLGGLLGAYDVSECKYSALLDQATSLGDFLLGAFNTSNGLPVPLYNWSDKHAPLSGLPDVGMASMSTMTLEFTRLSQLSGDTKYLDAIERVMDIFEHAQNSTKIPGLWPSRIDTIIPSFSQSKFMLGGGADSGYEYLIKVSLFSNKFS
jgi:mannosyl-oligosaccharide alpha-1,2-mannosidase